MRRFYSGAGRTTVVDGDPPGLAALAGSGVKKGKKLLVGPDLYDLAKATGIKPLLGCDDENRNC